MRFVAFPRTVLFIATGSLLFAAAMLTPIYALFAEDIGASVFQVGLLASTMFAVKFLSVFLLRTLVRYIRQPVYLLLTSYLLHAIAWSFLLVATTLSELFIVQAILGVAIASGSPSYRTLLARHLPRGRAVRMYASWELVKAATGLVASLAGASIVAAAGFSTLFQIMIFIAVLAFLWLWSMQRLLRI